MWQRPFLALLALAACAAAAPAGDDLDAAIAAIRPTDAERRWRLVPLLDSFAAAFARGTHENKPIYYFGVDGILDAGNC